MPLPSMKNVFAIAVLACMAGASQAAITTFSATTAGGPTFNRPLEDLSGLSAVGTAVAYSAYTVSVGTTGEYTFVTTGAFDTFSLLYGPTFNRTTPLTNALAANDDLVSLTTSGFAYALNAGASYVLVTTSFGNTDFGAYTTTIGGPGTIAVSPVPEPAAWALLAAGLAVVGAARRRQAAAGIRD